MLDIPVPFDGKAVLVVGSLVVFFLLERMFPAAPAVAGFARPAKNLGLAAVNAALSPLIVLPLTLAAARYAPHWRPEWLLGWTGLVFDILVLDLWIYWWHRANHEIPLLWRFHEVHHLDETLDSTSAVRFHFGEVLLSSLVRSAVIVALAVPFSSVVIFEVLIALAAIFHHSNLRLPARFEAALSKIVVTPSIHWVHHHAERQDTDSSYGTIFAFWDRIFRSRSSTVRTRHMQIGVEGVNDAPLLNLFVKPFSPRVDD
jgi:sterol desaturase/sphingolipid hydroxylase (fatty acid hydroxylase superfamily)